MCKIVGFKKVVDGYRTAAGFMKTEMFKNACFETATITGMKPASLYTKRQAGKFLKARGIVFRHINKD